MCQTALLMHLDCLWEPWIPASSGAPDSLFSSQPFFNLFCQVCAQLGIRDKPRHPLAREAYNLTGNTQYLEWPGGLLYLREQIKENLSAERVWEREISMGGDWRLAPADREGDPMRGAAWNKGTTAGCEASRELNCQQFKGGEQRELRVQILAGTERLGRKAFPHKRKRKGEV